MRPFRNIVKMSNMTRYSSTMPYCIVTQRIYNGNLDLAASQMDNKISNLVDKGNFLHGNLVINGDIMAVQMISKETKELEIKQKVNITREIDKNTLENRVYFVICVLLILLFMRFIR